MKKIFIILLFIALAITSVNALNYTIELTDSWGDGWDDASITVKVNGIAVLSGLTLEYNEMWEDYSFVVELGDTVETFYTSGFIDEENGYQIKNETGQVVAQSGQDDTNPSNMSFYVGVTFCPQNYSTSLSVTPTLTIDADELFTNYEIYFGDTPNPETVLVANSSTTSLISYTFTEDLEYYTDYYWKAVLYDENNETTTINLTFKTIYYLEGQGTEDNPYLINNIDDLVAISEDSFFWSKHFIQTTDIDAGSTLNLNDGAGFSSIGYDSNPESNNSFIGSYDGQGYTISNLYINRPDADCSGMFGSVRSAEISNLGLVNAEISGGNCVGCLVGYSFMSAINDCYAIGAASGHSLVGGLVGKSEYTSIISNSYAAVIVSGSSDHIGGLIGSCDYSTINNSYAVGAVNGNNWIGGLVGYLGTYSSTTVNNCYSSGAVNAENHGGGLIGGSGYSTVNNSFWDVESSGQATSEEGIGKTTEEMKCLSTYLDAGWDFIVEDVNGNTDLWYIQPNTNSGYPYLVEEDLSVSELLPNFATISYPNYGVINLATSENLFWERDYFGLSTGFKICIGTDNPPTNVVNNQDLGLVTSYEYSDLDPFTTYYWQVIPYTQGGEASDCPVWSFTTGSQEIISVGRGVNTSEQLPIEPTINRSYSQSIYLQSELDMDQDIEKLAFYITEESSFIGANQWKVYLGHTNKTEFSADTDWLLANQGLFEVADITLNETIQAGWMEIELDTPFPYNNNDNLIVGVMEYNAETSDIIDFYTVDTESNRSISYGVESLELNPNTLYSGALSSSIPKVNFTFSEATTRFRGLAQTSDNTPLVNANVYIEEFGTLQSNILGEFNIQNVEAGNYQLVVSTPWFETQTVDFQVVDGQDNYLEITLLEELLPANNVVSTLAEDFSNVNITWTAPTLSRDLGLSKQVKGRPSQSKANLIQRQAPEQRTSQPQVYYNLYRYLAGEETSPENWDQVVTNLDAINYTDNSFPSLELGTYYWAVEAVYANNRLAEASISNEIIKLIYLESSVGNSVLFGSIPTGYSETREIIITNSGTAPLTISDITCDDSAFTLVYAEEEFIIEPSLTFTIEVSFAPQEVGIYTSELVVNNNSNNLPNLTISLDGYGGSTPLDPENVQLTMSGNNGNISWDEVTEDINNNPITPDLYIVYYNGQNNDLDNDFYYLGISSVPEYSHLYVGAFSEFMFYRVKAYIDVNDVVLSRINLLVSQKRKVSQKEIESLIHNEKSGNLTH